MITPPPEIFKFPSSINPPYSAYGTNCTQLAIGNAISCAVPIILHSYSMIDPFIEEVLFGVEYSKKDLGNGKTEFLISADTFLPYLHGALSLIKGTILENVPTTSLRDILNFLIKKNEYSQKSFIGVLSLYRNKDIRDSLVNKYNSNFDNPKTNYFSYLSPGYRSSSIFLSGITRYFFLVNKGTNFLYWDRLMSYVYDHLLDDIPEDLYKNIINILPEDFFCEGPNLLNSPEVFEKHMPKSLFMKSYKKFIAEL